MTKDQLINLCEDLELKAFVQEKDAFLEIS